MGDPDRIADLRLKLIEDRPLSENDLGLIHEALSCLYSEETKSDDDGHRGGVQPSWDLTPQDQQEEIIENAQNDLTFDFKEFVNGTSTYLKERGLSYSIYD